MNKFQLVFKLWFVIQNLPYYTLRYEPEPEPPEPHRNFYPEPDPEPEPYKNDAALVKMREDFHLFALIMIESEFSHYNFFLSVWLLY
jgi:hypothetical protein